MRLTPPARAGEPCRFRADGLRQAVRPIDGRGPTREPFDEPRSSARTGVVTKRVICRLELLQRGHQGLGDVPATEVPLQPPATGPVRVEDQAGGHGGRPERGVRPVVAGGARPFDEQPDEIR